MLLSPAMKLLLPFCFFVFFLNLMIFIGEKNSTLRVASSYEVMIEQRVESFCSISTSRPIEN